MFGLVCSESDAGFASPRSDVAVELPALKACTWAPSEWGVALETLVSTISTWECTSRSPSSVSLEETTISDVDVTTEVTWLAGSAFASTAEKSTCGARGAGAGVSLLT